MNYRSAPLLIAMWVERGLDAREVLRRYAENEATLQDAQGNPFDLAIDDPEDIKRLSFEISYWHDVLFCKVDFCIDFWACVQGVEVSNFVCTGCKFFCDAVILLLHNATTSHACLLQTMKIAPAASAKDPAETGTLTKFTGNLGTGSKGPQERKDPGLKFPTNNCNVMQCSAVLPPNTRWVLVLTS